MNRDDEWQLIERYFNNGGADCDDCEYKHSWVERHPWGMGTAGERLCECQVERPEDCPAFRELTREAE